MTRTIKNKLLCVLLVCVSSLFPSRAEQVFQQRDFGFGSMEISQFKYETSNLIVHDMNRDGLEDILFLNNNVSRLEVLIRLPSGSTINKDHPLTAQVNNKGFVLDQWSTGFQVADIDGDKRPDIISMGKELGIVVHFQQPDGSFTASDALFLKNPENPVNLNTGNLNNDSHIDILLCRKSTAQILWNNGKGQFKKNTTLDFSSGGCRGAMVTDINGDRHQDLLFFFKNGGSSLRVRAGNGKGDFGWEQTLLLPPLLSLEKLNLEIHDARKDTPMKTQLAVLLKNRLILRLYDFVQKQKQTLLGGSLLTTNRLPLMGIGKKDPPTWLNADFNNDGYSDFCVAAPLLSQIHLYMGGPSGLQAIPKRFDSLTAIKTLKRTRQGDLIVFSPSEKAIAYHPHDNLTRFPVLFKTEGKPVAMTVGQPDTVFAVFKPGLQAVGDKSFQLKRFSPGKSAPSNWTVNLSHKLKIDNAPQQMKVFPLSGKNHWLIMLFMAYEPPVVLRLHGERLTRLKPDQLRAMSLNLEANGVNRSQKKQGIIISEGQVARLYNWQDEKFAVTRQLNPSRKSARLTAACRFTPQKGKKGLLVYDESGQDLIWFDNAGQPVPIGFSGGLQDIVGLSALNFKGKAGLLLVGKSDVQWLVDGQKSLILNAVGEYTSKAENPALWRIIPVTLGSPGKKMMALLDSKNRSIELVAKQGKTLKEQLVFEVFQDPGFREAAPGFEPHALASGDFNGDKIYDLAILVHNKLIIYLGH